MVGREEEKRKVKRKDTKKVRVLLGYCSSVCNNSKKPRERWWWWSDKHDSDSSNNNNNNKSPQHGLEDCT